MVAAKRSIRDSPALDRHCELDADARSLLDTAYDRLQLSARALTRILKVARTIADLEGRERLGVAHGRRRFSIGAWIDGREVGDEPQRSSDLVIA